MGSFVREDGSTGEMGDVNFKLDTMHTRFVDEIELTPEQMMLPDVVGSGNVRDLAQAAATSAALTDILTKYAEAQTKSEQVALLESLILEWAKTDVYGFSTATAMTFAVPTTKVTNGTGGVRLTPGQFKALAGFTLSPALQEKADALIEKVNILDSFTGSKTSTLYITSEKDVENFCNVVEKSYLSLLDTVYCKLAIQTRLEEYAYAIDGQVVDDEFVLDYSGVEKAFREVFADNPAKAFVELGEFIQLFNWQGGKVLFNEWLAIAQEQGVADEYLALLGEGGFLLDYQKLDSAGTLKGSAKNDILQGSDTDDQLEAGDGDDVINAADGNDRIYGGNGSDTILGGCGNDAIYDGNGDDTVDAGEGSDYISGGQGSDRYIFKGDFGKDTIYNYYSGAEDVDTVEIQGRNRDEFTLTRYDNDLYITDKNNPENQIEVDYFFDYDGNTSYAIEQIKFADQTLDLAAIKAAVQVSTDAGDNLYAYSEGSKLAGGLGNDSIRGSSGADEFSGDDGNDKIYGKGGDDIINGGNGDDHLEGGDGNDIINGGDGNDHIEDDAGDDIVDAGNGNDYIVGYSGSDTYIFQGDFGKDKIYNGYSATEDVDRVQMQGKTLGNFSLAISNNDLIIAENGSENQLCIGYFFSNGGNSSYALDEIVCDDAKINLSQIVEMFKSDGAEINIDGYSYTKTEDDKGNVIAINFEVL